MADRLSAIAGRIDRLIAAIGRAVMWLALAVVLGQFAVVLMRYLFGIGSIWLAESIIYAHAALFLLAAGWTLQANGHVRVDVFYSDASPRAKAIVDLLGSLILLMPFVAVIAWYSLPYAARSWAVLERSRETSGLPFVYLLKTLIPKPVPAESPHRPVLEQSAGVAFPHEGREIGSEQRREDCIGLRIE